MFRLAFLGVFQQNKQMNLATRNWPLNEQMAPSTMAPGRPKEVSCFIQNDGKWDPWFELTVC